MSNVTTHHYPSKAVLATDPLQRLRITNEGIEPLLYMLTHTVEFHRSIHMCADATEAEARVFGGLLYPKLHTNHHPTINQRLFAAVEDARQLRTSTVASANASQGRFGAAAVGNSGPPSLAASTSSGSYPNNNNGNPNASTASQTPSMVMRPPPSLFGTAGGGGGAPTNPSSSIATATPTNQPNHSSAFHSHQRLVSSTSLSPCGGGGVGGGGSNATSSALHRNLSIFGRPFTLVINIGRIEKGYLGFTSTKIPLEQWRFYCLKTPHAIIQVDGSFTTTTSSSSGGNGYGTSMSPSAVVGDTFAAYPSPLASTVGGGIGGSYGNPNTACSNANGIGAAAVINLLSNDLAQGKGALRFIADTCLGSGVLCPSIDTETFYNTKSELIYYDVSVEREQ